MSDFESQKDLDRINATTQKILETVVNRLYEEESQKKVLEYMDGLRTQVEVAKMFKTNPKTAESWVKQRKRPEAESRRDQAERRANASAAVYKRASGRSSAGDRRAFWLCNCDSPLKTEEIWDYL
jgi:hypothetical protein